MRRHELTAAVEFELGPVASRLVILLFFAVLVLAIAWGTRERMVTREVGRLQRAAGLPPAGADGALVLDRLRRRHRGRVLGIGAALIGVGALVAWFEPGLPWLIVSIPMAAALGTCLGQLQPLPVAARRRVAHLRRRELRDYVTPLERRLLLGSAAFPALALLALLAAVVADEPSGGVAITGVLLVLGLALVGALLARALSRVLAAPVELSSAAGLQWTEIIRAQSLRDLAAAGTLLASAGSAAVLWWVSSHPGGPDWLAFTAYALAGAAVLMLAALLTVSVTDRHFTWARDHALAGVGG